MSTRRRKKRKTGGGIQNKSMGRTEMACFLGGGGTYKPNVKILRKVKRPIDDLIKYGRCSIIKISVISARFTSA